MIPIQPRNLFMQRSEIQDNVKDEGKKSSEWKFIWPISYTWKNQHEIFM